MALEAVVYQTQQQHLFGQNNNNNSNDDAAGQFDLLYPFLLDNWASSDHFLLHNNQSFSELVTHDSNCNYGFSNTDFTFSENIQNQNHNDYDYDYDCDYNYSSVNAADYQHWRPTPGNGDGGGASEAEKPKPRRRSRAKKNTEEIENQRMTHIAVERNRRKQMNDYLSVLRSLMPNSYVQRGDQASIIGGAINFVKELEQTIQCLSAKKHITDGSPLPFGEFITFPQYSSTTTSSDDDDQVMKSSTAMSHHHEGVGVAADVEVTMVESHALLKIRSKQPPKQLSKLVLGLQALSFTILHLNVSKLDGVALYSFSVKVEDTSKLISVEEIAKGVYQLLGRIQEEAGCYF